MLAARASAAASHLGKDPSLAEARSGSKITRLPSHHAPTEQVLFHQRWAIVQNQPLHQTHRQAPQGRFFFSTGSQLPLAGGRLQAHKRGELTVRSALISTIPRAPNTAGIKNCLLSRMRFVMRCHLLHFVLYSFWYHYHNCNYYAYYYYHYYYCYYYETTADWFMGSD